MKLSVIVPVHNNGDVLESTLKSIRAQTYEDFEVLIIDDGSTDNSSDIIDAVCAADGRFRSFAQDRAGVSAARNVGLDHARGDFITFVDGDDRVPKRSFEFMHQIAVTQECDIIVGEYRRIDGTVAVTNKHSKHLVDTHRRVAPDNFDLIHGWSLWNKWFSRELIERNHVRMEPFTYLEDGVFVYACLQHAERIFTCPHVVYTYRKPLPSAGRTTTQQVNERLSDSAQAAFERIEELTSGYGDEFHQELMYRYLVASLIGDCYRRLWTLTGECAEKFVDLIGACFERLDEQHRQRLLDKELDIFADGSLQTKQDILRSPLLAIGIDKTYRPARLETLLTGLYDQSEPHFVLLVADRLRESVPDEYAHMENLRFVKGDLRKHLQRQSARYVLHVNRDIVFNHQSLLSMIRVLERRPELGYVSLVVRNESGGPVFSAAQDPADDNPRFVVKMVRRECAAQGSSDECAHVDLDTPPLVALFPNWDFVKKRSEIPGRIERDRSLSHRIRCICGVENTAPVPLPKDDDDSQPASDIATAAKKPAAPSAPKAVDFYLNEDVRDDLIVIEGIGKLPKGNTLCLLEELSQPEYQHYHLVFSVKEESAAQTELILKLRGLDRVETVMAGTPDYKRAVFSAHYLFNEVDFPNWWIKKPGQVYVNLWHGTPIKELGRAKPGFVHQDSNGLRNFTMADYLLFPNEFAGEHLLTDYSVKRLTSAKALLLGYPRAGRLLRGQMRDRVREEAGAQRIYAWMPTWRDTPEMSTTPIVSAASTAFTAHSMMEFLAELDARLADDQLMYVNLHHRTALDVDYSGFAHIRPFPVEYDTYDLLSGVEVLITDYSSVLFDFAVTGRKVILYAPDYEQYRAERGLYFPLEELPFPLVDDADAVIEQLNSPKEYDDQAFLERFAPYDSADNVERLCKIVVAGEQDPAHVRQLDGQPEPATILYSEALQPGPALDLLYELKERGYLSDDVYLSYVEQEVDENYEPAYPLVRDIPLYATKGTPLSERTERQRLYGDLQLRKVVLMDLADPLRIRCFARFDEPVHLFVTEQMLQRLEDGDGSLLKALRLFKRLDNGFFAFDAGVAQRASEALETQVMPIEGADAFVEEFL